jgi:hypothetical protein
VQAVEVGLPLRHFEKLRCSRAPSTPSAEDSLLPEFDIRESREDATEWLYAGDMYQGLITISCLEVHSLRIGPSRHFVQGLYRGERCRSLASRVSNKLPRGFCMDSK